ncbi:MAG: type II toxin-antitoxin system PemK/MazF family toxin [Chitinophagaceae bacterium]|nr:type II toxin-antitoxin system PemK/MazF family toxin [Chitinophagaceae bacterium]
MKYERGEIVWVKFPFSNSATAKLRPALIISNALVNRTGDYLMMQVTTRLRNDQLSLTIKETDYSLQPLLKQSELRLHKISVLNEDLIGGDITKVTPDFMSVITREIMKLIN